MPNHALSIDWVNLFAPAVAGLVMASGLVLGAIVTGLLTKLKTWLDANGQSAAAQAVAAASAVIQPALQTGASVIAGKIAAGTLDYTNRQQITAEAVLEVGLVKTRVPGMLAIAAPREGALVASMMGKVDALLLTATPAAGTARSISSAVQTIADAKTALASLDTVAAASAPAIAVVTLAAAPSTAVGTVTDLS